MNQVHTWPSGGACWLAGWLVTELLPHQYKATSGLLLNVSAAGDAHGKGVCCSIPIELEVDWMPPMVHVCHGSRRRITADIFGFKGLDPQAYCWFQKGAAEPASGRYCPTYYRLQITKWPHKGGARDGAKLGSMGIIHHAKLIRI